MFLKKMNISRKIFTLFCTALSLHSFQVVYANSLNYQFTAQIPQNDYDNIVRPIVNASRFQFMSFPGASSGRIIPLSISAGAGVTYFDTPSSAKTSLSTYTNGSADFPDSIIFPRIIAQIGIPFGLDIAVNYAQIPNSKIELSGVGFQLAIKPKLLPLSFAARVGYTQIANYEPFTASSTNAEILIGAAIPFLKPYIGAGANWSNASTNADFTNNGATIHISQSSTWTEYYGIGGIHLTFIPFIGIDFNAQLSESQTLYNAKLSLDI
ncbi:DUF6588 family protein [Fluviispira multicolorata]|uniref:Outer membrane protein beta-barrel domain-containing protein n=1 Tax=Fluviispira multicolorata TaxID=2654512 RepID=A0A833JAE9_9BACT|nr:DUF6588 family protein [Fluviispira multicolorata]KAB8027966.1 hypothetical protein GCL57_13000 [Fluviispira multicolorata]